MRSTFRKVTLTNHTKKMTDDLVGIPANAGANDGAEILHGLNNALASMLLNAHGMEWKLPPTAGRNVTCTKLCGMRNRAESW